MKSWRTIALSVIVASSVALIGCGQTSAPEPTAADPAAETTIYVVRHGETWFNVQSIVSGWSDSFLTEKGEEQANAAGKALADVSFDAVLSSDLGRALDTAETIVDVNEEPVEITGVHELREQHYGGYDGMKDIDMWVPIMEQMGYPFTGDVANQDFWSDPSALEWYGSVSEEAIMDTIASTDESGYAEDWDAYQARLSDAIGVIENTAKKHPGGNVLVVSHGGAIGTLLHLLSPELEIAGIGNASISTVTYKDGTFTVRAVGEEPSEF
ncbi:histidine phosphatase family protein [Microbacterium sp.]|uniref:histidine phosphatase family protein n=1 Tax=Microbacterium sp. TaxID=51671 RepID=UPI002811CB45|nr:histidine phosphatase family protein [Microbacterium sp.]